MQECRVLGYRARRAGCKTSVYSCAASFPLQAAPMVCHTKTWPPPMPPAFRLPLLPSERCCNSRRLHMACGERLPLPAIDATMRRVRTRGHPNRTRGRHEKRRLHGNMLSIEHSIWPIDTHARLLTEEISQVEREARHCAGRARASDRPSRRLRAVPPPAPPTSMLALRVRVSTCEISVPKRAPGTGGSCGLFGCQH